MTYITPSNSSSRFTLIRRTKQHRSMQQGAIHTRQPGWMMTLTAKTILTLTYRYFTQRHTELRIEKKYACQDLFRLHGANFTGFQRTPPTHKYSNCVDTNMHVHRTPALDSMGASDKRVEMKGKVSVSGFLRGLAALREHKCLLYHQNWLRTCLPTCWHRVSFPEFILEGFSPISDKNSSGLVQAKSAHPKASTQILELMLSHLKKVFLQEQGCSETTDKLMGTLTGSYNL